MSFLRETGFECSDPDSFYSSVTGGFRNTVESDPQDARRKILHLAHGVLALRVEAGPRALAYDIEVLEDAWVYDLVCRWVFSGSISEHGEIAGETVPLGSRLYHQHAVTDATLGPLRVGFVGAASLPASMSAQLYLRCEPCAQDPTGFQWIVHARAIARDSEKLWLKGLDGHAHAFSGHPVEAQVLTRRRERAAPIYEQQIQPHARLLRGSRCRVGLEILPQPPDASRGAREASITRTL